MSTSLPNKPSQSTIRRNPDLYAEKVRKYGEGYVKEFCGPPPTHGKAPTSHPVDQKVSEQPKSPKPLLNATEKRWLAIMESRGICGIMQQAITLRMDPPFRSYTADLAFTASGRLVLVEVKGPHRFREKGIAKAALAAKTYPQFTFLLAEWKGKKWRELTFSP